MDLSFIIGGGWVEIFKNQIFFPRPPPSLLKLIVTPYVVLSQIFFPQEFLIYLVIMLTHYWHGLSIFT